MTLSGTWPAQDAPRRITALLRPIMAFVVALVLWAGAAFAQSLQDDFDARGLDYAEKRLMQAALAFSGDYIGLLDGDWGAGSQRALDAYSLRTTGSNRPTFDVARTLLSDFGTEVATNDWQTVYFESVGVSYAHPLGLLIESPDKSVMQFDSADDSFSVVVDYADRTGASAVHAYVYGQGQSRPPPYQNYQDDRLITSVTLPGGLLAYVRSDWVGDGYVTFSIIASDQHRTRLSLIAGSLQKGQAPQFVLPASGRLATILTGGAAYAAAQPDPNPFDDLDPGTGTGTNPFGTTPDTTVIPEPQPEVEVAPDLTPTPDPFDNGDVLTEDPPDTPDDWNNGNFSSSGTGFYINRDYMVTAAHVVEGCQRMELSDTTVLEIVRSEPDLDLAVLKVPGDPAVLFEPGESDVWLELSPQLDARLGETVTALGFPYLGRFGQGLTVTGGNVSALPGGTFGESQIMISAPVQPGNSGGPLLNADGEVIGVVVARIDDIIVLEETGTLPQNMNFAVTNSELSNFLKRAQVTYPPSDGQGFDLSRGVPEAVSSSVVPLFCFE
jgi:serine protease Do